MDNFKHSIFIAYHGTYSSRGTEQTSRRLKESIEKRYPIKSCYCGPDTDETLFTEHTTKTIPSSQLFLLVVNDDCPKDASGAMSKDSQYLIGEITSFLNLVKNNERNKKDFAVYYTGNLCKNINEASVYVKNLLSNIDPDYFLWEGNQYYIIEDVDIDKWITHRIIDKSKIAITNQDYFPFEALENKLCEFISQRNKGIAVLIMERGMGKTTLARYLSKYTNKLPNCEVLTIFLNNKEVSLEEFVWELSDRFRINKDGTLRRCTVMPINVLANDLGDEFNKFVSAFKHFAFSDKKILLIIDGIQISYNRNNRNNLLQFFKKFKEIVDGVYVLFTMQPLNNVYLMKNVSDLADEVMEFDKNNVEYLMFLYKYFNENIVSEFSHDINKQSQSLFDAIVPKNILAFSIYYRICRIYFSMENTNNEFLKNLGEALHFYYRFIERKYDKDTYLSLTYILVALSMISEPTPIESIKNILSPFISRNLDFSDNIFGIFLSNLSSTDTDEASDIHNPIIIHEEIRDELLNDNVQTTDNILNYIIQRAIHIFSFTKNVEEALNDKTLLLFLPHILCSNRVKDDEKNTILDYLANLNYQISWSKSDAILGNEIYTLNLLLKYNTLLSNFQIGKIHTILGLNNYMIGQITTAGEHLAAASKYFKENEAFTNDQNLFYAEFLTILSTYDQLIEDHTNAVKNYETAIEIYCKLRQSNTIDEAKYINNMICLCHVYAHAKAYKKQRELLKKCDGLLAKYNGVNKKNMQAFLLFSYAYFHSGLNDVKKAVEYCDKTIDTYLELIRDDSTQVFVGDILECFSLKIQSLTKKYIPSLVQSCNINEQLTNIENIVKEFNFNNNDFKLRVYEALLNLYLVEQKYDLAKHYFSLINTILDNILSTATIYDYYIKIKIRMIDIERKLKND